MTRGRYNILDTFCTLYSLRPSFTECNLINEGPTQMGEQSRPLGAAGLRLPNEGLGGSTWWTKHQIVYRLALDGTGGKCGCWWTALEKKKTWVPEAPSRSQWACPRKQINHGRRLVQVVWNVRIVVDRRFSFVYSQVWRGWFILTFGLFLNSFDSP